MEQIKFNFFTQIVSILFLYSFLSCSGDTDFGGSTAVQPKPPPSPTVIKSSSDVGTAEEPDSDYDVVTQPPPIVDDIDISISEPGEEKFLVSETKGLLDIVWLIDTSSSMDNEIEQVISNFNRFISSLESSTKIRLTLVAQKCNGRFSQGRCISLDASQKSNGHGQTQIIIDSNGALAVFGFGLCAPSDSSRLCKAAEKWGITESQSQSISNGVQVGADQGGKVRERFRDGSNKVVVIVTDDNAPKFGANDIQNLTKEQNIGPVTYFSFSGLPASECGIAAVGNEYMTLAQATGGKNFDICSSDWRQHFDELTANINSIVNNSFTLSKPAKSITSISLKGVELAASKYTFFPPFQIRLDASSLSPSDEIVVKYVPE